MQTTWSRTALLCAPLLLALAPVSDELAFRPKDDTEVAKKLDIELELGLDDVSLSVNGQDIGKDAIQGIDDLKVIVNMGVAVTDKYVKSKEGKVQDLLRTFDELSLRSEMGDTSKDDTDVDEFEGRTVRFLWNAEKKEYEKSFQGKEADASALEELHPDMDVTCLLPEKKVAEGDTWEVHGEALAGLFFPGGLMPAKKDGGEESGSEVAQLFAKQLEEKIKDFKVTCTYKGAREDGKVQVGEIAFQFDGKLDLDLQELLAKAMAEDGAEDVPEFEMTTALTMKGEGTLKWDLAGGHVRALAMQADLGLTANAHASMEQDGQSLEIEARFGASGKGTWEMGLK